MVLLEYQMMMGEPGRVVVERKSNPLGQDRRSPMKAT
jgi:hypothetical protein